MTEIAVLGTGKMGAAFAKRLKSAGYDLTLWNRTRDKAEGLALGPVAPTPAEATRKADIVISSLTGPAALRDVYLGPQGVLRAAAGKLVIDMSTAGPDAATELAQDAGRAAVRFIEAPVVGSVPAVETGTLLVLAGGSADDVEIARPVLQHLGEVRYTGGVGSASRLKLVANSMLGITTAAAAELLAASIAVGLEPHQAFGILTRYVPGLRVREAGLLGDQAQPTMFAVRDLVKDLNLALEVYASGKTAVPLTSLTRDLFTKTAIEHADLDISAIAHAAEQPAKVRT